jgi:hypothetical protein
MSYEIRKYMANGKVVVVSMDDGELDKHSASVASRLNRTMADAASVFRSVKARCDAGLRKLSDEADRLGVTARTIQLYAEIDDRLEKYFVVGTGLTVLRKATQALKADEALVNGLIALFDEGKCTMAKLDAFLKPEDATEPVAEPDETEPEDATETADETGDKVEAALAIIRGMDTAELRRFDSLYRTMQARS